MMETVAQTTEFMASNPVEADTYRTLGLETFWRESPGNKFLRINEFFFIDRKAPSRRFLNGRLSFLRRVRAH